MNAAAPTAMTAGMQPGSAAQPGRIHPDFLTIENGAPGAGDGMQFRAALERQMQSHRGASSHAGGNKVSLGDKIIGRTTELATSLQKDQQYVSKMLEQATRNADSMQLMKAMVALNDYEMRVQFISKTASKAATSLDQLTKLQ